LFYSPITPNQVTFISTMCGIAGGILLAYPQSNLFAAGIFFYLKDIFDSADGQLARAKKLYSRHGRFYDSIGDFVVHLFLFGGIFFWLIHHSYSLLYATVLSIIGFLGVNLRVSYHVYHQTAFLHQQNRYVNNRLSEKIQKEDLQQDLMTIKLQKIFLWMYGWQDTFVKKLDEWCIGSVATTNEFLQNWYQNRISLFLNGLIGIGTEFVGLTICLLFFGMNDYLIFSLVGMNGMWMIAIFYRFFLLKTQKPL
jgi:hypothetical protein